ncbi:MAG: DMT family transporter [Actinobacteria bacterium]|nr:DMT family transporter [Actinomycetota bacterium]
MPQRLPVPETALVGVCAVWGLTFVMVQDAIAIVPTMTFLAYRFIPATLLVTAMFWRRVRGLTRDGWKAGLLMGVFLTGGYVFQTFGLERTTAANAGFITGTFCVLTPLLGALLFGHKVGVVGWSAALVAAVGLYLLSDPGGGGRIVGDVLVFLCAVSFSFHILATDRALKNHDLAGLLAVQLGVCGVFSLVVAVTMDDIVVPRSAVVWQALAVTAVLASALAFWVQAWAQKHASPARTALILASEPAFAGLFAYLLQGDTLSVVGWTGAALIMAAIVAVEVVPYLRTPRPLPEG